MTLNTHFLIQEKPFEAPVFYTDYKNLGITEVDGNYPCMSLNLDGSPEEILKKVVKTAATALAVAENNEMTTEQFSDRVKELIKSVKQ